MSRLDEYGFNVAGRLTFNDHHIYSVDDLDRIYRGAIGAHADIILCTQKDWVKIALLSEKYDDILFAYLALELEFVEGADKIEALVDKIVNNTQQ